MNDRRKMAMGLDCRSDLTISYASAVVCGRPVTVQC